MSPRTRSGTCGTAARCPPCPASGATSSASSRSAGAGSGPAAWPSRAPTPSSSSATSPAPRSAMPAAAAAGTSRTYAPSPQAPHGPQVRKGRLADRGAEVGRTGRAAGAAPAADRPLDHLDVVVPPLLHALVEVDQELAHRGRVGVVVVDLLQHLLHPGRGLDGLAKIAVAHLRGDVVSLVGEVADEGVEQRRPRHRRLDALPLGTALGVLRDHHRVAPAEHRLTLAELGRLEAARRAERGTE